MDLKNYQIEMAQDGCPACGSPMAYFAHPTWRGHVQGSCGNCGTRLNLALGSGLLAMRQHELHEKFTEMMRERERAIAEDPANDLNQSPRKVGRPRKVAIQEQETDQKESADVRKGTDGPGENGPVGQVSSRGGPPAVEARDSWDEELMGLFQ